MRWWEKKRWENKTDSSNDPFGPNPLSEKYDKLTDEYKYGGGSSYFKYKQKLEGMIWNLCLGGGYTTREIADKLEVKKDNYVAVESCVEGLLKRKKIEIVESRRIGDNVYYPVYRSVPRTSPV